MICMKKVRFSSCPTAKVRCHRPLSAARVTASPGLPLYSYTALVFCSAGDSYMYNIGVLYIGISL